MTPENPLAIDVATRTTRGRACPRCGGKIIPSDRAVYQNSADPDGIFPIWQCERCGYEEMAARPKAPAKAKPEATKQPRSPTAAPIAAAAPAMSKSRPDVLLDAKSRPYPPDVLQLVERMKPLKRES